MSTPQVLFVCRDCDKSEAGELRKYLKQRLKSDGLRGEIRVVRTECMGLCPKDGLSVCAPGEAPRVLCPERSKERDQLYANLLTFAPAR